MVTLARKGYSVTASTSPLGGFSLGSNPSTPTIESCSYFGIIGGENAGIV